MNTTARPQAPRGPLQGLKVLDIATIIAGPSAAALLADYGASVTKLELPAGDGARGFPPMKDGKPLWWKVINRNKTHGTLDLRKPEGKDLFLRLLKTMDVLVENFRPGTMDRWGLDRDTLWQANPRLVILRVTGFGQTGPYRNRPGFARIFEAMGGLTHPGYPLGDSIGGLYGVAGILAALWKIAHDPDAKGEEIDLSMTEASLKVLDSLLIRRHVMGENQGRNGNISAYSAPSAVFKTADQHWVTLSGSTDAMYANNCRAIQRPDLITDERFCDNSQRVKHYLEITQIFRDWIGTHSLDEVLGAFVEAEGTLAPIYTAEQIVADPQMKARDFLKTVADEEFGTVQMAGVVPRFVQHPGEIRSAAVGIGRHNPEIYADLGLSQEQIKALTERGVL
jgi:crotonobetainyl-CoA:carnitine CoA-transferase CaiB-like acyl-CoA transferase